MLEQKKTPTRARSIFWTWLTAAHPKLQDIGDQRAAQLASAFTLAIFTLSLIGFFASSARVGYTEGLKTFGATLASSFLAYVIARSEYYKAGVFIFTLSFCASGFINVATNNMTGDYGSVVLIYIPLGLIVASNFLPWPAVFLLTGLNVGGFFLLLALGVPRPANFGGLVGITTTIGVVLIVLKNFQDRIERIRLDELRNTNRQLTTLTQNLEERVEERTQKLVQQAAILEERALEAAHQSEALEKANTASTRRARQFQAVAEVSRALTNQQSLDKLLPLVARVIHEQFGFYHVGIFMADDANEYAILTASNSPGGQRMLQRNHRLKIGQVGIVGNVVGSGMPRIALDTGADITFFNNPDLPDTHSEMALPLRLGEQIIGALDVQSTESNAFSNEDIEVLTTLADQVSAAIQNARQYTDTQRALAEAEAIYRQALRSEWKNLGTEKQVAGFQYSLLGTRELAATTQTDEARQAIETGELQFGQSEHASAMAVPIKLRGEVIGILNVRAAGDHAWSQNEIDVAQAVAERVAISAENARLFEETTSRAERERAVADITNKIRATNDPHEMITTALAELKRALNVEHIKIMPYKTQNKTD